MATKPVAASATEVTLLAANARRTDAAITNDSAAYLYIKHGTGVSTSSFRVRLDPGGLYELPQRFNADGRRLGPYTGTVTGLWSSATGQAVVSEEV
jgi:hypothetical protein